MAVRELSEKAQKFWNYGCRIRRHGKLPAFRDFDLMTIHDIAPNMVVIDVERPGWRLKNRFVGTTVVSLFGETTGRYMDEIDLGEHKQKLLEIYEKAVTKAKPYWSLAQVVIVERLDGFPDRSRIFSYERLVYPLAEPDGEVKHLAAIIIRHSVEHAETGLICRELSWPDPASIIQPSVDRSIPVAPLDRCSRA